MLLARYPTAIARLFWKFRDDSCNRFPEMFVSYMVYFTFVPNNYTMTEVHWISSGLHAIQRYGAL